MGFLGTSAGSFTSGLIVSLLVKAGNPLVKAYRAVFLVYFAVALIKVVVSLGMTTHCEVDHPPRPTIKSTAPGVVTDGERQPLLDSAPPASPPLVATPPAKLPIVRLVLLCILFSWDSFASSLIPISFISYYWQSRYSASVLAITRTLGAGALIAGSSQLLAGSLARRIGIIPTMVFTHS